MLPCTTATRIGVPRVSSVFARSRIIPANPTPATTAAIAPVTTQRRGRRSSATYAAPALTSATNPDSP